MTLTAPEPTATVTGAAPPPPQRSVPSHPLSVETAVLTTRVLRRWLRDPGTLAESLIMPVVLLVTLNIVLGDGITQVAGENALHRSVPLIAMVGAMSGAMVGGIGVMRERDSGLLARLWVLPVHRGSGLVSRLVAEVVRIVVTTLAILIAGLVLGFRFEQGVAAGLAWVLVPTAFGVAFSMAVITLALYSANTLMVEATEIVWGLLMFFSTGFVPLDQYPDWIQPVVQHQPVSYAIEAMHGLSAGGPIAQPLAALLAWSVVLVALCALPMALGYRRASMRN
ncbi:peptide ABC transporter permease [Mycolicibacillus koreensis]|nr:peptide ABC transporter permease [Mycolicibacillus koreensis]